MQGPAGNASRGLPGGPPSTVASGAGRCESGALMHSFGIFLQGLLGVVAFSTLMLKRFREPKHERRPWRIWFLDTSKQAIGMLFIHFANVYLADLTEEDPCSLYLINFLLDATVGMLLIYVGVRAVSVLVEWQQWESLRFGEYGDPLQCGAWVGQCALYIVIMIFEKSVVFIVLLILQWKKVALLNPIENPDLKLAIVMLIVPFFVNALMFWVVDNFLMRKGRTKAKLEERGANQDSRNGSKVRYRRAASHEESESEFKGWTFGETGGHQQKHGGRVMLLGGLPTACCGVRPGPSPERPRQLSRCVQLCSEGGAAEMAEAEMAEVLSSLRDLQTG
ncbi:store-operated calcium entry regulator STIMATE isoform X1 [Lontra canadensis]|uniref:store-operated calcium entry regulator STIMATE isoform X1 n=1 Tax=Lontra canadensis TaxID=76717 RepID=UPI0013F3306E|nr:store-operated calcium entry regulator STIMATE isoform X1 [Lontra canadensis]